MRPTTPHSLFSTILNALPPTTHNQMKLPSYFSIRVKYILRIRYRWLHIPSDPRAWKVRNLTPSPTLDQEWWNVNLIKSIGHVKVCKALPYTNGYCRSSVGQRNFACFVWLRRRTKHVDQAPLLLNVNFLLRWHATLFLDKLCAPKRI